MNSRPVNAYSPSLANLRSLLAIRAIALLGQTGVLAYVVYISRTAASLWGVAVCLVLLALLTCLSLWRTTRPWPVGDTEFLVQLLVDVVGWTALMYFTGGANNPFVSYYIVPLVIAAAVLPWRFTWLVAGASLLAYSLLLYFYVPLPLFSPHAAMGHGDAGKVHVLGMWFNFLFSAGLITYFVVRMAAMLRSQAEREVRQREERLRNEQIMAVASLAAGTAHELGTPLSTMTVLVDELAADPSLSAQAREDCDLLRRQLRQCRSTLSDLGRTAETTAPGERHRVSLGEFTRQTLERWAVRRPGVPCELTAAGKPGPHIECDLTLHQALENLLNNAADTGSAKLQVSLSWNQREAVIAVRDWGPGIPPEVMVESGRGMVRADRNGLGIGLMISHATAERHGGRIELRNASGGGTEASLVLPVCAGEVR